MLRLLSLGAFSSPLAKYKIPFDIIYLMRPISISTKSQTSSELLVKEKVEKLLKEFDISDYFFTDKVHVEDGVIPHSHPVLTINSFPYSDERMHLTDLLHEQLHWYLEEKQTNVDEAVKELKLKYQKVPVGHPFGCRDETSTYEHLLLCRICYKISSQVLGQDKADRILYYLKNHHYIWVYETIEKDGTLIDMILDKHGLNVVSS